MNSIGRKPWLGALRFQRLFILVPLLLPMLLFGQYQPIFRHLTVDEGLSASEVYHVYQDSYGYIWFATNNGVSKFDGYSFENFDLVSGLADNTVFEIYEDYKHRVWFIPFSGNLSYYENGVIRNYPFNSKIKQHFPNSRGPIKMSFYVDSLDNIYLGLKQFGLISISPEGIYKRMEDEYSEGGLVMKNFGNGKILMSSPFNAYTADLIYSDNRQNFRLNLNKLMRTDYIPLYTFAQKSLDSSIFISVDYLLLQIKNGSIIRKLSGISKQIIWMSIDDGNNLWVSAFEGGVYLFPNCDLSNPGIKFLNDYQVTSVLRDTEGSYWFSTLNDGVFYAPNYRMKTFSKENGLADNRVNAIFADDARIYVGFEMGFVDIISGENISHQSFRKLTSTTYVRSIFGDTLSNRVWVCTFSELGYFLEHRYHKIKVDNSLIYPRKIIRSSKGGYWVGTAKGLRKIDNDKVTYDSQSKDGFSGMVFSLVEDSRGAVWLSTINGLWKYSNGIYQYIGDQDVLLTRLSHSMFFNPVDSSLWIGTNGAGIVIYSKYGEVSQISVNDGLISNSIHHLHYSDSSVWVATRQGLSLIAYSGSIKNIMNFTIDDGLPSNEITSVYTRGSYVYVGTNKGLAVIDFNHLTRNATPPAVLVTKLVVDGADIPLNDSTITLGYSRNTLDISYVGLAYKNMGRIPYRHRMVGLDTNWVYTKSTNCLYSGLNSGKYTFQVQARNSNGVWSSAPAAVNFVINPPFWERAWFIVLITLVFAGFLYLVYLNRIREINKRNELLSNINLYKQQSLRQQMNPHFIFNTLNSIQYYILERDTISSHKYLTKFARLMRMTLDNSQSSTIPLRDEIDALRLYLELEALRLEGKFVYTIDYGDNEAILDVKIPTLLIQPFVENAIWHGIMLKSDKSGYVNVDIKDFDDRILCTIEDNGVGREEAKKLQENRAHKSRGFLITQQRIDLLNSMYRDKFDIKITDLYNSPGAPSGTLVSITIPKALEFNG